MYMNTETEKLKKALNRAVVAPELLELERFLVRATEAEKALEMTADEKLNFACAYHQVWWFRDKQIKKSFPDDDRFVRLPQFVFTEFQGAAERSLEILLERNPELSTTMNVPQILIDTIGNASKFITKKQAQLSSANTDKNFYIIKRGDDFFYKGKLMDRLSKDAEYYKVFCALFDLLPTGGEISYTKLIAEIKSRIRKVKSMSSAEARLYIQKKLTEKGNGFQKYAELNETEDNQKPLLKVSRNRGILFNNQRG